MYKSRLVGGGEGRWRPRRPPTSRRDSLVVVEGRWRPREPLGLASSTLVMSKPMKKIPPQLAVVRGGGLMLIQKKATPARKSHARHIGKLHCIDSFVM